MNRYSLCMYFDRIKAKRKEKLLAKSTLQPYVSVTLSHAGLRKFVKDW